MFPIDKLMNLMRQQAIATLSSFTHTRAGTVTNYNEPNFTARVQIQPEEILTPYLPILTPWVGNGWGMYFPPNLGDLVLCHFMEGDFNVGFVGQHIPNLVDKPINNVPSGEGWIVHKTGTYIKFHNDGTISIGTLDIHGNPTNINIASNIVVTGNISATGNILDNSGTNAHNISAMRTIFNQHIHHTPAGDSSAPTTSM